ncbi:unnamed protein product [Rotaria sp. Silwood1]|nr:unnamed protein product [Rotaria sp. Silwood1]CAF3462054.1 unnamed protein product [Rotaria sp. Silwood1]CAF4684107.1 unnamed protein product [Rotaria sp. Silwood1]
MAEVTSHERMSRYKRLYYLLIKINLFDDKEELSLVDQLLATRIFLSLLIIILSIVIAFTAFSIQTNTVTIQLPNEIIFEKLSLQYPSTLSCPCTQSSIRHDQFLLLDLSYHPICTSQFVNQTFISSLYDYNMSDYYPLDYRIMIASHFQLLSLLCRTIKEMVSDTLKEFAAKQIITNQVLSHSVFNTQVVALVEQLKSTTTAHINHINDFVVFNIFEDRIYSALRTNYFVQNTPGDPIIKSIPVRYRTLNVKCSCIINNTCVHQAGIYNRTGSAGVNTSTVFGDLTIDPPLLLIIPGIMVGCLPYNSLFSSTLECFYNQSCIDQIQIFINGLSLVTPLSLSRFSQNTTVNDLFNQLFIELWNEKINFTNYFQVCSPQSCTYSYDRRFNLLYVVVTIISLFGGLKTILYFSAPLIVMIIRRLRKLNKAHNTSNQTPTENQIVKQSLKYRFITYIREIYQKVLKLNMFPLSSDIADGIYSTRIYILLFIIGILILVFYSSISIRIRINTVYQPSLNKYEQLYTEYPSTLVCPCTRLSVSYSSIIHISPYYHQVCSSDFIKNDGWLLYFQGLTGAFYSSDFRLRGSRIFTILQTLCKLSSETVTNELAVFNDLQFVSGQVLTKNSFDTQTSALIQQFQQQTLASFIDLFKLIRALIQLNQFIAYGSNNAILLQALPSNNASVRFASNNDWDYNCSCGTSVSCIRSEGFYCRAISCFVIAARPNQTIPGLVIDCLLIDSFLASSLECFYNPSCIQMLIKWHSFDSSNVTIDPRVMNVMPLDPIVHSRFSPDTTLNKIVSQLFIEDWTNSTNFSFYYNQCAPDQCTYTYEKRFNRAYIIATILGIVGGLSTALRILILPIVKLLRRIYHYCRRRQQHDIRHKIVIFCTQLQHSIRTINFYYKVQKTHLPEESQTTDEILLIQRQQIATRFYIILVVLAFVIIITFTGLNSQIYSITIKSPTEFIFEQLQTQYSSSLSCPCSQIAIQYSKFLSVKPIAYHQVCSSYFISFDFIELLWGTESSDTYYLSVDMKILSTQFRLLSSLCSLVKNVIEQKIEIFSSQELLSVEILTRHSFQTQIDSIITNFIIQAPTSFRRIHQYIIGMFHANQLHNIFYTNWNFAISTSKDNYIMSTSPITYNNSNGSCSCATMSTCSSSLLNCYGKTGILPGLVLGCLPIYGLRLSTLECFYNSTCLQRLSYLANSKYPISLTLDVSIQTRFTPVSSISVGTLIDELFIEAWQSESNYSKYFSICAPLTCRYAYMKRNNALYTLTICLGLYGGLTVGLKYVVWHSLHIYSKIQQWLSFRRRRIKPINQS